MNDFDINISQITACQGKYFALDSSFPQGGSLTTQMDSIRKPNGKCHPADGSGKKSGKKNAKRGKKNAKRGKPTVMQAWDVEGR